MNAIWEEVLGTLHPSTPDPTWLLAGVALGALLVWSPVWSLVRPVVTVVHELGHALVGILCGRRFTGFVVSADMSGHTVTRGRPRGPGIVVTTAAGYPMPALVGALVVWSSSQGWSRLVALVACAMFLVALVRSRSLLTVVVLIALTLGSAALWWVADLPARPGLVVAIGVVLLVGAWRQLVAVMRSPDPGQDPAVLARLTGVPAGVWNVVFLVVVCASTAVVVLELWPVLVEAVGQLRATSGSDSLPGADSSSLSWVVSRVQR